MKIFLVEDCARLRKQMASSIGGIAGVDVSGETGNARDAIRRIPVVQPDVVILDIKLDGGSGIEVLEELKRSVPSAVTIIFTGQMAEPYRERCRRGGADYFFTKGGDTLNMFRLISRLAQSYHDCSRPSSFFESKSETTPRSGKSNRA